MSTCNFYKHRELKMFDVNNNRTHFDTFAYALTIFNLFTYGFIKGN